MFEQLQSIEGGRESREELAHPLLLRGYVLKTSGSLKIRFFSPIQGEPIKEGGVPLITPNFK